MPLYSQQLSYSWQASDHGLLAASVPPHVTPTQVILPTAGRLEFVKVRLLRPAAVTNIVMSVITAGATLTSGQCFAALYTEALAKVGVTATQHTAWESTGTKTMALASGPFSCAAGNYYVGVWYNGTTAPTFRTGASSSTSLMNLGTAAPAAICGFADTGLTTTAPDPMGAQTTAGTVWWVGLS